MMIQIDSYIIKDEYTPAITIVELCNKADIGVGADIAFNSHVKKGNCADLEKITIKITIERPLKVLLQ